MLTTTPLPRIFFHSNNGSELRLADPSPKLSPDDVRSFYANTYSILTTARIEGPEIVNDEVHYTFVSTLGTKG